MSVKWNDDSVRWHLVGVLDDTKDTLFFPHPDSELRAW